MEEKISKFDNFELNIDNDIIGFLKETSSWTYFLSILGFFGIGLIVILGLYFSLIASTNDAFNPYAGTGFSMAYFGLIYIIMGAIYIIPIIYLFNFSRKMKAALKTKSNVDLKSAFSNMKSHYKFIGIFTLIVISLYALALVFAVIASI